MLYSFDALLLYENVRTDDIDGVEKNKLKFINKDIKNFSQDM